MPTALLAEEPHERGRVERVERGERGAPSREPGRERVEALAPLRETPRDVGEGDQLFEEPGVDAVLRRAVDVPACHAHERVVVRSSGLFAAARFAAWRRLTSLR